MNRYLLIVLIVATLYGTPAVQAAPLKVHQVTGPVRSLTERMIQIQKGQDMWQIERRPSSYLPSGIKVGSSVTVEYTMVAVRVARRGKKAGHPKAKQAHRRR